MSQPPRVVILDCDGVILESVDAKTRAFGELFAPYGPEAARAAVAHHLAHGGVSRFEKFRHIFRQHLGRELPQDEERALGERFSELCYREVLAAPFVPGAREFIEQAGACAALYVASGTPEPELLEIFRQRGLAGLFRGVFGSPANKAAIIADILAREGVGPREAIMVGDSTTDLEAALATDVRFFGRGAFPGQACADDLRGLFGLLFA
jgi:phosphoglycolate phosphatase-like HAD superfamily hydrolase